MVVGLFTDPVFYKIGNGSYLHCFFSTIAYRLESNDWGGRFPILMNKFYNAGGISYAECKTAIKELSIIRKELLCYAPDKIVWDIDDLTHQPPWGNNIAEGITSLANYFWTSEGKDLFETFNSALNKSTEIKQPLVMLSL